MAKSKVGIESAAGTAVVMSPAIELEEGFRVGQKVVFCYQGWLVVPAEIERTWHNRDGEVMADLVAQVPIENVLTGFDADGMVERKKKWELQERRFLKAKVVNPRTIWVAREVPIEQIGKARRAEQSMVGIWADEGELELAQVSPVHMRNIGGFFDADGMLFQIECYRGKRELQGGVTIPPVTEMVPADGGVSFEKAFKKLWKVGFKKPAMWDRVVLKCVA